MRKSRPSPSASRRGFALVVVLAVVLMISVLIVGLLIMAENETKAASRYMDAADARLAADSVVEIVQGQIKEATLSGIGGDGKGTHAWASQPGAVRVFDDSGDLVNVFKLYSSDVMVSGTANFSGDVPANWQDQPDAFVDLNAPVSRNNQWIYPIASPEALGTVVGFSSSRTQGSVSWDDRLAMPVRWIYVQEDGSMSTDPAVGDPVLRLAYWTDDESSKININTASATDANSYADIPRANFRDERAKISLIQPAQNEFNRYPGHPASVSLSTVFPAATLANLIEATPRYQWGGSENATKSIHTTRLALDGTKRNRLYSSPDEILYGTNRAPQLSLTPSQVDARRFFLTTTSRSSDLNLFGQPRVSIWPVYAENSSDDPRTANALKRTPYDQLIANASTIGAAGNANAKRYIFVRRYPLSQELDWTSFARNRSLFQYLQTMTSDSRNIPGFGGSFQEKYSFSKERDQILTEIFDSIRCTNLNETFSGQPANFEPYTRKLDYSLGSSGNHQVNKDYAGAGYVLPIRIDDPLIDTRGAGRAPVLSEVGIWLIQTYADEERDGDGNVTEPSKPFDPPRVQVGLVMETFSPMQGPMTWMPLNFGIRVRNITAPRIGSRELFPDNQTENFSAGPIQDFAGGQGFGGPDGWAWTFATHDRQQANTFPHSLGRNPPWAMRKSDAIELAPGATTVDISGGEIEIQFLCAPNGGVHLTPAQKAGTAFQTYRISIPAVTVPVPDPKPFTFSASSAIITAAARNGWYERGIPLRFYPEDVVRGIELRDGDSRIAAYCQDVPTGFFREHEDYASGGKFAHGFRLSAGINTALLGTTSGGYVGGLTYGQGSSASPQTHFRTLHGPDISSRITDLRAAGWEGDFDTGIGNLADGPYLNKSDEGGLAHNNSDSIPPYFYHFWYRGIGLFSPLKQVPSAVVFGSLPSGVKETLSAYSGGPGTARPWRTLNFCPNPASGGAHFGLTDPPDYLLLDLFTMPIVEPYAISEPFSTAGRLNMNYQIVPFTHIERKTAMVAALSAQQVTAISDGFADNYKDPRQSGAVTAFPDRNIRFPVNVDETLKQFDTRFSSNDLFRSASEICGIHLVPNGATAANVATWWNTYRLTGNNLRERPYATLYPLLTTKSNVFTTHLRAQAIRRTADGRITVNGEYRGSVTFERFLDPNDPRFTDGTVDPDEVSLEPYFRFRTLTAKQFDL